jgi:Ca2+-binding EF-hand superfamily protein
MGRAALTDHQPSSGQAATRWTMEAWMMRRLVVTVLMGGLTAGAALAEEDALAEAMSRNPERFEARAIDLIAGFGGPEGLRADGIETHIALERAGARASALRRFLAMDLDADGSVSRAELRVSQHAASAQGRGRMERQFASADADGNGAVDAGEMTAFGTAAGLQALGDAEADLLRALMQLDADGNGVLQAAEVSAAIARLDGAG